jgi:RNA polymerase sigma-70 factor (ECF subfamily)
MFVSRNLSLSLETFTPTERFHESHAHAGRKRKNETLAAESRSKEISEPMPLSDNDIIDRIRKGEKHLYARLVQRYKDKGMSLSLRMLRKREEAEEALQDAFVRAYNGLEKFQGASKFGTWFFAILYNVCLTRLARLGRKKEQYEFTAYDEQDDFAALEMPVTEIEREIERKDLFQRVKECLEALPEKYAMILTMFYVQDLSYDEICEITGLPLGTVKIHLFRGRTILQERITREHIVENTAS